MLKDNIRIGRAHRDIVCLSISSIDGASIAFLLKGIKFCLFFSYELKIRQFYFKIQIYVKIVKKRTIQNKYIDSYWILVILFQSIQMY